MPSSETEKLQILKKDILRSTTFRASPLTCHGSFHRGLLKRTIPSPFIDEMSIHAIIKTPKSPSDVAAVTLELIEKEQRRTQASFLYLKKDGAKNYKTKVL